ncbi:hypothetical protein ID854_06160 [Xenorhabdus sp. M]|uniref:Uncharacterized protein n=1 Tax=Xenorhabdus szentirmaii TaxID=290112 RepID=A0AAW3YRD1_9GAMM|nr:hypothetical protein [Xenorhabdus sp. M]MBD2800052.1 hypothetical protein [Xenorhabdus sp. M]
MKSEKFDKKIAMELAINKLNHDKIPYIPDTLVCFYMEKYKFHDGFRSGWLVSAKLNVAENFEPDTIFVEVSEHNGTVYIPSLL